ncbi:MAG: glycoside hydrolase family 10 protein [Betaproteobacteria bacterium]
MSAPRATGVLGCALLLLPALAHAGAPATLRLAPPGEMRGLWVVRTALVSPQEVDRVVDEAADAGFNALFVQARGRGDAFYHSSIVARSTLLERQPGDFDPLARLIARARARRLQVHAWLNVLLTAHFGQPLPRGHVLAKHPDWAMVPRSVASAALVATDKRRLQLVMEAGREEGDVEGYYLSPAVPGVGELLESVVRELLHGYALDGVHLDFIRYPGPTYDYSRAALEGFRRRRGGGDLLQGPAHNPAAWDEYRRDLLTSLARRLAEAARSERPGILVSAAVVPDEAQAIHHKFQDWPRWLESGILGAVCPMAYTTDSRLFQQQVELARERARPGQAVWAGIGAYRLDPASLVEKVELARQSGAGGVLVFSHESLDPEHLRLLREQAFSSRTAGGREAAGHLAGAP